MPPLSARWRQRGPVDSAAASASRSLRVRPPRRSPPPRTPADQLLEAEGVNRAERAGSLEPVRGRAIGGPGQHPAGERVAVDALQVDLAERRGRRRRTRFPRCASRSWRARPRPGRRSSPARSAHLPSLQSFSAPAPSSRRRCCRQGLHPSRRRAEPAEVRVHLAQARREPRQGEVLRAPDRDAGSSFEPTLKLRTRFAPRSVFTRPRGSRRRERRWRRRARLACRRSAGAAAGDEVAHVHARRELARAVEREPAGQVAGHPVVAHRGEHPDAGLLGGGPVALEHLADERRLARRVDVVRSAWWWRRPPRAGPSARTGPRS